MTGKRSEIGVQGLFTRVRRETGRGEVVKVHYGEGVATHTGPESCTLRREASREALTGVCIGQVVSGESNVVRGADAVVAAEGNRGGCDSASIRTTRSGPHAPASHARGRIFWRAARSRSIDFRVLSQPI